MGTCFICHFVEVLLFFFGGRNNFFKLAFLCIQHTFFRRQRFLCFFQSHCFFGNFFVGIFNVFFAKLYLELLHFNFFVDCFKLTVVLYIFALLFIFFHQGLCFLDGF